VKPGVLLLAHGAPERLEDVAEYLTYVRCGQPVSPRVVEEVTHRYEAIGGRSPLLHWTRSQAKALQALTGIPVFYGMRNWHPFIRETAAHIRQAGIDRLAVICLAPQYSEMSVGLYRRAAEPLLAPLLNMETCWARGFHDEPLLAEAFAERLRATLKVMPGRVLFTAHSLPEKALAADDPYDRESRAIAAAVAGRAGIAEWDFAYQSQGMTGDGWLGPTVESVLDGYATAGVRHVIVQPVGFVCDHVEILYDVDVMFRAYAEKRGMMLVRPESLNGSETFARALAAVARRCFR
jgi:ferrochelatase